MTSVLVDAIWLGLPSALFLAGVWTWLRLRKPKVDPDTFVSGGAGFFCSPDHLDNFDGVGLDARYDPDLEFKP